MIIIEAKWLSRFAKPGKTKGFAVFPFIVVSDKRDRSLVEHEKIHIRQQIQGLWIGFFIKYAIYHIMFGYKNNPYEVEAYKHQDDWRENEDRV